MMAMSYGNAYVATVAFGSKDAHTLKVFKEAEAYQGTSIIIAYSHCIAHGINMNEPLQNQKAAVDSGLWLLYRYNPDLVAEGRNPLTLDSKPGKTPVEDYMNMENRFKMLYKTKPEAAKEYHNQAAKHIEERYNQYKYMAEKALPE
jgi:pyruvate-ferredoxin/flavodoxin oxidoreductase